MAFSTYKKIKEKICEIEFLLTLIYIRFITNKCFHFFKIKMNN